MGTIASEFKGLPMADLIGGPLTAACDAQVRLANATADFIKVIGFQPPTAAQLSADPDAVGATRTVSFSFTRPTPAKLAIPAVPVIPATSTTPEVPAVSAVPAVPAGTETVELVVPTLAIVTPPALSIKNVDIVFDMEVKSSSSSKSSTDEALSASVDASAKWGVVKVAVHIQGSVATHKENTRTTDNSAKYHVEVHAEDTGMPEGLRRVLDIMNSAIVPVPH
jgi:Protein of unknown function (DUF2589)